MDTTTLSERLIANLESGYVPHAVILEGPRAVTEPAARLYAKALLCTGSGRKPCGRCASCRNLMNGITADLVLLDEEASGKTGNRTLKDERVEAMQDSLKKKPLASDRVVAVILAADRMTERAQNRLLKTLEEPPGRDALILLSENTRSLLPTILSRCQTVKAGESADEGESAVIREYAKTYWKLVTEGEPYYAFLPILRTITEDKPTADAFLDSFEEVVRDAVVRRAETTGSGDPLTEEALQTYETAIYAAEEVRKDLARNVNVGYAMKDLTLRLL